MQRIVLHILHDRRFWHRVELRELSELYISLSLKSLALNLIAIFIPVYFYQLGYTLSQIALFYAAYFLIRIGGNLIGASLVARSGPKHVLSYSYILFLAVLGLLLALPQNGWIFIPLAAVMALYSSLFFIAYHIDFSAVEDDHVAGKEISTMMMLYRGAAAMGPFVGGALAAIFGIHVTFIVTIGLLLLAIWPLMQTGEVLPTRQKVNYDYSILREWRNWLAYIGEAVPQQMPLVAWPLYLSVFVFISSPYVKVGLVATISIATTVVATYFYGRIVDKGKGRILLNFGALVNAVVNPLRPFAQNLGMVSLINVTAELAQSSQVLAILKGLYGEATAAKNRIGYLTIMENIISLARALLWAAIFISLTVFDGKTVFTWVFVAAGLFSLFIPLQKFRTLKGK